MIRILPIKDTTLLHIVHLADCYMYVSASKFQPDQSVNTQIIKGTLPYLVCAYLHMSVAVKRQQTAEDFVFGIESLTATGFRNCSKGRLL